MNTENNHNRVKLAFKHLFKYGLSTVMLLAAMTANMSASSENQAEVTFLERAMLSSASAVTNASATDEPVSEPGLNADIDTLYINRVEYPAEKNPDEIKVTIDGNRISGAMLKSDTTYVPLRTYFSSSKLSEADITWNEGELRAEIKTKHLTITIEENSNYLTSNGRVFYSPSPIYVESGIMYVPVRLLASATGASLEWNESERKATVLTGDGTIESGDTYYNEDDLYWLSRIIHAESRGEPFDGQIAVGCVIMNRVKDENFPDTIYEVIFDIKHGTQFTPTAIGTIYNDPDPECITAAKICLEGYTLSSDIIYFINERLATTTWVTSRPHQLTIGNHDFYS